MGARDDAFANLLLFIFIDKMKALRNFAKQIFALYQIRKAVQMRSTESVSFWLGLLIDSE